MSRLLAVLATLAAAYAGRSKLVNLLTKTTGTWVGSPTDAPRRP